jgi:hypothetical protein
LLLSTERPTGGTAASYGLSPGPTSAPEQYAQSASTDATCSMRAAKRARAAAHAQQQPSTNGMRCDWGGGGGKSTPTAVPKPERGDAPGFCALRHLQHPKSQNAKRTALAKTRTKALKRIHINIAYCSHPQTQDQLRDHTGKKRRYWLVLKETTRNTRRPLFFSACVGMVLVNNISARKKSRREVGSPGCRSGSPATEPSGPRPSHGPGAKLEVGPPGPRTTPSPTQLLTGPRGRTAANIAASGPSDRPRSAAQRAGPKPKPTTTHHRRTTTVHRTTVVTTHHAHAA